MYQCVTGDCTLYHRRASSLLTSLRCIKKWPILHRLAWHGIQEAVGSTFSSFTTKIWAWKILSSKPFFVGCTKEYSDAIGWMEAEGLPDSRPTHRSICSTNQSHFWAKLVRSSHMFAAGCCRTELARRAYRSKRRNESLVCSIIVVVFSRFLAMASSITPCIAE